MLRLAVAVALGAIALLGAPGAARAHQSSATFARLEATDDPARLRYEIKIAARDLYEALALESDREATAGEIRAGGARLHAYLAERIAFEADGRPCRTEPAAAEPIDEGQRMARLELAVVCPAPIREVALEYDLFFDLDPRHIGFVEVAGTTAQLTAPDDTRLVWQVGGEPPGGLGGFLISGVEHILYGLDHILFLISLLLMAVVMRRDAGEAAPRPLRQAIGYTAAIVTSFTVAHSVTLIGAALGWFELPGRLVESVIAASIALVAVDNAVRLDPPHRALVTFGFGLIHGLGFASMLRPLLPPEDVVLPLLAFNVGVELGQLALVALALPLLAALVRVAGAGAYRRLVLPGGAIALGGLGVVWLIERAFEVTILGL
ncbi:MAG TPA: HupE/UreJ family protein [Kofleriaceae bacterium]|nr:HupE/UreJ family protein [Kofleriaceae bacterium]